MIIDVVDGCLYEEVHKLQRGATFTRNHKVVLGGQNGMEKPGMSF